ncbi:hypothetical protein [Acinetobacter baumannii]|uniref:hypothetical protein n=1 Tax=Acinetobacter baumannii TaxID=470 RepID=UPI0020CE5BEA|nr:hypothetical protein [Acinetobacter baumannii]MCQ1027891.1 hypothetical protein [Acinetobacter baumannii]MCW1610338.1 hypothetical protein [Acinetobacter baumannii]
MTLKLLKLSFLVTAAFSSYVQAATSVNDILNKQIIATNSENINSTKVVSELCIFSCDLLRALLHKDLKCKAPLIEPNLRRNLGKWST